MWGRAPQTTVQEHRQCRCPATWCSMKPSPSRPWRPRGRVGQRRPLGNRSTKGPARRCRRPARSSRASSRRLNIAEGPWQPWALTEPRAQRRVGATGERQAQPPYQPPGRMSPNRVRKAAQLRCCEWARLHPLSLVKESLYMAGVPGAAGPPKDVRYHCDHTDDVLHHNSPTVQGRFVPQAMVP